MHSIRQSFSVSFIIGLPILLFLAGVARAEPAVGWELDLANPSIKDSFTEMCFIDKKSGAKMQERYSVEVADGVLKITGDYETEGDCVRVLIRLPDGVDLLRYPVFEVEWRKDCPGGRLFIGAIRQTLEGKETSAYYYVNTEKIGEWSTGTDQYVMDASFPTRGTPAKLTTIYFQALAGKDTGRHTLEIKSFKVRGFTKEEAAADAERIKVLRNCKPATVPEPWATERFPFGVAGYCRGPEGYESWFDNDVRCHSLISEFHHSQGKDLRGWDDVAPVEEYIEARRRELAVAKPRGLYLEPILPLAGVMKRKGVAGLPWLKEYTRALARAFHDEPYITGWVIADEPSEDYLWGVAVAADALFRADPTKLPIMNHFGIDRMLRFEPYMGVVKTDPYPIKPGKRDPWSIGKWCREMDRKSDRPQRIFLQCFGNADWWRPDKGEPTWLYPTRAELRLMAYLALANGVKGITWYKYSTPHNKYMAIFDTIGNPLPLDDPLIQDISAIGEKLIEIGPMLMTTKLLAGDAARVIGNAGGQRGLSVGVRQAPDESTYLVVVNESVETKQGGWVTLSKDLVAENRCVYDLYCLSKVAPAGAASFEVAPLKPGDGRIYLAATTEQFAQIQTTMLRNRGLEILRVSNLDRLVAARWGVDVSAIDAQFARAREAARRGDVSEAEKARDMVAALIAGDTDFARCRLAMLETRELLGRAYFTVHRGLHTAWPGCDGLMSPTLSLLSRFSPLAERYFLGDRKGLLQAIEALRDEGNQILSKARASRGHGERRKE